MCFEYGTYNPWQKSGSWNSVKTWRQCYATDCALDADRSESWARLLLHRERVRHSRKAKKDGATAQASNRF